MDPLPGLARPSFRAALFVLAAACQRSPGGGGAPPAPPPRFLPLLGDPHLPEGLRAVRFGDSTRAHIRSLFADPRLSVEDFANIQLDRLRPGVHEPEPRLRCQTRVNPNVAWPYVMIVRAEPVADGQPRSIAPGVGLLYFYFGMVPNRAEPVLVRAEA